MADNLGTDLDELLCELVSGARTSFLLSALWTLPGRRARRSRSPNWLNSTHPSSGIGILAKPISADAAIRLIDIFSLAAMREPENT
ncbi:hypothetical protein [Mesorhizobium sp. M0296]|uniref:hypothetical protein n=1 Tax=Mesorhizobium sp. M0296 TaxID=2956931 RepID=UPI003334EC3B